MKIQKPFLLFVMPFLTFCSILSAQTNDSLQIPKSTFFIGGFVGIPSYCNLGRNNEAIELSLGCKQLVVTGRFYRAHGGNGYFFEDAVELGWKKKFWKGFSNTVSGGYSDLAFEIPQVVFPEISPENFQKIPGLVLEDKLAYNFHWRNQAPSVWGIAANYYCVLNSKKTIQGWSVGIDFLLEDMYWQNPRTKTKRKHLVTFDVPPTEQKPIKNLGDTIAYRYRIRTNFITGMFFSPHIDFEHRYSRNWGWGFGFLGRPGYNQERGILRLFDNPDYQLSGGGGFVDWIYFSPVWKNDHYWSFGLRCGYRYLSGICAIGDKIYEPDYYIYRERQDIVTAWRVSFVMPPMDSHWSIDWYFTAGARTSFYHTTSNSSYWQYHDYNGLTGCYVLPEFVGGLEFGFGW